MDDLFNAIKLFNSSMSDLATNVAVQDAREQVNKINATVTKEGEKRQAMQGLANDLALRLSGAGAPATTIQSAFQAVAPERYATPEQAQFASQLQGADTLAGAAEQGIAAGQGRARQKGEMDLGFDIARMREKARLDQQLLGEKVKAGGEKRKDLTASILNPIQKLEKVKVDLRGISELLNQSKNKALAVGPIGANIPARKVFDKDFTVLQRSIQRFFNNYKLENTGTAASEAEMELLANSIIKGNDPVDVLEANLRQMLVINERDKASRLRLLKQSRYDTSGLEEDLDTDLIGNWDPVKGKLRDSSNPGAPASVPTQRSLPKNWEAGE